MYCAKQMQATIIPADLSHLDAIVAMEHICFSSPWDRGSLKQELEALSWSRTLISIIDDAPVGYLSFWSIADEYQILKVAVHPRFRRRHIARQLLDHVIQMGKLEQKALITLELRASNAAAKALYESNGFHVSGQRKRYYSDTGEDAILMNYSFQ